MSYEPLNNVQVRIRIFGRSAQYTPCQVTAGDADSVIIQVPRGKSQLPWVPEGTEIEFLQKDGLHSMRGRIRSRALRPVPTYVLEAAGGRLEKVLFHPKQARTVLVTGGKGGTGKTFVSIGLGLFLAQQGSRVLLIDADLGTGDVAVNFGLTQEPHIGHLLDGKASLDEVIRSDVRPQLSILPGATGSRWSDPSSWKMGAIVTIVTRLREHYDHVIVDSRAGIGADVTGLLLAADRILFVTADEPAGFSDTFGLLQAAAEGQYLQRGALVVNRVRTYRAAVDRILQFRERARQEIGRDVPLWSILQEDPRVHTLAVETKLLAEGFPLAPTSVALRQLAARVQAEGQMAEVQEPVPS